MNEGLISTISIVVYPCNNFLKYLIGYFVPGDMVIIAFPYLLVKFVKSEELFA